MPTTKKKDVLIKRHEDSNRSGGKQNTAPDSRNTNTEDGGLSGCKQQSRDSLLTGFERECKIDPGLLIQSKDKRKPKVIPRKIRRKRKGQTEGTKN